MPHFNESRVAKGMKGAKFTYLFYFLLTKYNERIQFVEEMFFTKNLRQVNFSIFIVLSNRGLHCRVVCNTMKLF